MSIETIEDAQEYTDKVVDHLKELSSLSEEAGLYTHAAIWCATIGAFLEGPKEVKTISDMIGMYLEHKLSEHPGMLKVV